MESYPMQVLRQLVLLLPVLPLLLLLLHPALTRAEHQVFRQEGKSISSSGEMTVLMTGLEAGLAAEQISIYLFT